MAIDKSVYAAPMGLASLPDDEGIEVEIIDPEEVNISGPGFDIHIEPGTPPEFDSNLAEEMDELTLTMLASELLEEYEEDLNARKEWLDTYVKGLKLLGLKYEERSDPWPGACGVFHPLLMESAIKFQSETVMETFPAGGPVRTKIIGRETNEKLAAARRVETDMNYQLTEVMQEYRPEHERLLMTLCLSGNAFKKVYFDPSMERQVAAFIGAEDVIVPYGAPNLESAERVTHRMRKTKNEMRKLQVAGFYRDIDLGDPVNVLDEIEKQKAEEQGFSASSDTRYQILEMHVDLDLEGYEDEDEKGRPTGIALPYVVTIEKGTGEILAIRRNWLSDDKLKQRRQHFVHYGYVPGFGFYYFGLIHLIGGHTQAATSLLRQLVDAGTLSNLPGGLKTKGMRVRNEDTPIAPGEWRDVDLPSGAMRDNILPLPYKEPSQTLSMLMDRIVEEGKQFAAASNIQVSDMSAQAPVGTTLAVLERALKVMSAVQARVHYAMKQEFKLLAAIIRDNTPSDYDFDPSEGSAAAKQSDYDQVDVIPVSDPNSSTLAQRVVQYQAVMQLAQTAPQIYNLPALHRQMIEVLGVKNAAKLVPEVEDAKPMDPVSENMAVLMGKPVKAFLYQDHEAHLQVHMSALQDPKIAQMVGQNPQAQAITAAAQAHIMEHVAFQYRKEIEQQLGATLPVPPDFDSDDTNDVLPPIPPEIEVQLSQLAAKAAAKLLQKDVAEAKQQEIQQQMQDPLVQMQQIDLQIKKQLAEIKMQEAQTDAQYRQGELALRNKELEARIQKDQAQLALQKQNSMINAAGRADDLKLREAQAEAKVRLDATKIQVDAADAADRVAAQEAASRINALRLQVDAARAADDMALKELGMRGRQQPPMTEQEEQED